MQKADIDSSQTNRVILHSLGYEEVKQIGRGSFGQIFSIKTPQGVRAIKTESKENIKPMLVLQYEIMDIMKQIQGFPQVYKYQELQELNFIQMQIFNKSLDKVLKQCNNKFTLKTTIIVMLQALERLKQLHKKGYIYRDVKPSNFIIGQDKNLIYILDFGLVKKIGKARPVSPTKNKKLYNNRLVGTPIFCSIAAHVGQNQGPKDDLQSLIYMGIFFVRPLPWQNIQQEDKLLKQQKIKQIKISIKDQQLCKDLPKQFLSILRKIKGYQQQQQPQYDEIKLLLQQALKALDPRKNIFPEWVEPIVQKPKPQIKINFQIKPKTKKKIDILNADNTFQQIVQKNKEIEVKKQVNKQVNKQQK